MFLVNAASFIVVTGVIAAWRSAARAPDALPREHVGEAVRAGGRYIAASPVLRVILARAGLFIFFASAIWALLPLTVERVLHLGSGGYGCCWAASASAPWPGPSCCPGCAPGSRRTPC